MAALLVLHLLNGSVPASTWWFGNTAIGLGLGTVGAALARKVPANPIGWLFLAGALCQGVTGAGREWAVFVVVGGHHLPGAALAGWLGTWLFIPTMATLPLILLHLPDGRLPSRRWRPVRWAVLTFVAMGVASVAVTPGPFTEDIPSLTNPLGVKWAILAVVGNLSQVGFEVTVLLGAVSLLVRMRGADPEQRQQIKWVAFAGALLTLEVVSEILPWPGNPTFFGWIGPLAVALFILSIAVAVLRFRLWDIDLLIKLSIVYGFLTAVVTVVYLGVVALIGNLADQRISLGPSLLAAGVAVAVMALLRDRVQRLVDRLLYGDRRDPYRALSQLGARLDRPAAADDVLDEVVDAVAQSLRLDHVSVEVADGRVLAHSGVARSLVREVPLMFRGTEVGRLIVAPRPGARIGPAEQAVLADLARPVAAVLQAVAAGEALQRSRQALVTTREEERRRVRRDLHDGLGPALAGIRMKLDGTRMLVDSDPEEAKAVLVRLTDDIRKTIDDIRHLVYDLQPPILDEVGLLLALSEQTEAFTGPLDGGGFLTVELEAPRAVTGLSAAVEVAVYRIVCEGLANVARHSGASHCKVTVSLNGGLDLRIDDDGVGMSQDDRPGLGTASMVERASELGGTCRLGRSPFGGTQVTAHLPVPCIEVPR